METRRLEGPPSHSQETIILREPGPKLIAHTNGVIRLAKAMHAEELARARLAQTAADESERAG